MMKLPAATVRRVLATGLLTALLAGCAATAYQQRGATGGYSEERVADASYDVRFSGNGFADADRIWSFWIYRCAELTREQGYSAFKLEKIPKTSSLDRPGPVLSVVPAALTTTAADTSKVDGLRGQMVPVKGGASYYVPAPGGATVTRYTAQGRVTFFKPPYPTDVKFLLDAERIITVLKPFVSSNGAGAAPSRAEVLKAALILPPT